MMPRPAASKVAMGSAEQGARTGGPILGPALVLLVLWGGGRPAAAQPDPPPPAAIVDPALFVAGNLAEFRRQLADLEEVYRQRYGLFPEASLPAAGEIACTLPGPRTLRFHVGASEPQARPGLLPQNLPNTDQVFFRELVVRPVPEGRRVAVDAASAHVLNLPDEVAFAVSRCVLSYILAGNTRQTNCCTRARSAGDACDCEEYAVIPEPLSVELEDADLRELGPLLDHGVLRVIPGEGAAATGDRATVRFTGPGRAIAIVSGYRAVCGSSVPCYQPGDGCSRSGREVCVAFRQGDPIERTFEFSAVKFEGFGIPGLDLMHAPQGDSLLSEPAVDFFTSSGRQRGIETRGNLPQLDFFPRPLLTVSAGDGSQAVSPERYDAFVETRIVDPGPIGIGMDGQPRYLGGMGATTLRWLFNGKVEVQHRLSVCQVEVELDPDLDGIVQQGAAYPVRLLVRGGADMSQYTAAWFSSDLGRWREATTPFALQDEVWVAGNELLVQTADPTDWRANLNRLVAFSGEIRRKGEARFSFSSEARLALPAIRTLALYAEGPRGSQPARRLDLFYPNDLAAGARLTPHVTCWDNDQHTWPFSTIYAQHRLEVTSSSPEVVQVDGFIARPTEIRPGAAEITARFGPDLNPGQQNALDDREVRSAPVSITANQLILHVDEEPVGRTYRLTVHGPADLSGYHAVFLLAPSARTAVELLRQEDEVYTASLTTALALQRVQLARADTVVAEMRSEAATPQPRVRLVLSPPPMATLAKTDVVDASSLQTTTDCEREIEYVVELLGFDPGKPVSQYCAERRQRDKQEMKRTRAEQKAYNQLIEDLDRRGRELVVLQDAMRVGAAVSRLPEQYWRRTFCRWSLSEGSQVELDQELTPVVMTSAELGGCFNLVRGLQDGFDPAARLQVRLVVDTAPPQAPRAARSGSFVGIP